MSLFNAFEKMATEETAQTQVSLLSRILMYLMAPIGYDKSQKRYRQTAVVESGTITTVSTVTTVTTCNTVSNLTSIGGRDASALLLQQSRASWALNVRSRFS